MDYLWDTFNRTSTDTWGSSEGPAYCTELSTIPATTAWTLSGTAANFDVASDVGTIANAVGGVTNSARAALTIADTDLTMDFQWSANPATAATFLVINLGARATAAFAAYYAARIRVADVAAAVPGRPFLSLVKNGTVVATTTETGGPSVDGKNIWWRIRFKCKTNGTGVDLYAALWRRDTETEAAALTKTITNTDAGVALASAGVGVRFSNSGTGAASTLTVDNFRAAQNPAEAADHKKGIAVRLSPSVNPPPNQSTPASNNSRRAGRSKWHRTGDVTPASPADWLNPAWRAPGPIITLAYNWRSFYNDDTTLGAFSDGSVQWASDNINVVDLKESCVDAYQNNYRLGLKVYTQAESANRQEGSYPRWIKTLSSTAFTNPTETLSAPLFFYVLGGEQCFYTYNWVHGTTIRRLLHRDMIRLRNILETTHADMGGAKYGSVVKYLQWSVPYRGLEEFIAKDNAGAPGDSSKAVTAATRDATTGQWTITVGVSAHGFPNGDPVTISGATGSSVSGLNGTYTVANTDGLGGNLSRNVMRLVGSSAPAVPAYDASSASFYARGSAGDDENFNRNQWRTRYGLPTIAFSVETGTDINNLNVGSPVGTNSRRADYKAAWIQLLLDQMMVYAPYGYDCVVYPGSFWQASGVAPNTTGAGVSGGFTEPYDIIDRLVFDSRTCFGVTNWQVRNNYSTGVSGADYFPYGSYGSTRNYGEYSHIGGGSTDTFNTKASARGYPLYEQTGGTNIFNDTNYPSPSDPRDAYYVALQKDAFEYRQVLALEIAYAQLSTAPNAEDYQTIAETANFTITVPQNTVLPAVTGTFTVGQGLTCSDGTWTNSPSPPYGYQWKSSATSGGTYANIGGATSNTYTLTSGESGLYVKCTVTATNGEGSNTADSTPSLVATGIPVNSVAPAVTPATSNPPVGTTLTSTSGTWSGSPTFGYKWQRAVANTTSWADIPGATSSTYVLSYTSEDALPTMNNDERKDIQCVVTATNGSGSASANSNTVEDVIPVTVPGNTVLPVIAGDPWEDQILTCTPGTWTHNPFGYTYQWQRSAAVGGLRSGFDKGTSGNTIATTDAGDPDAWEAVSKAADGTVAYDSTRSKFGALSAKFATGATASPAYLQWSSSFGTVTEHFWRLYIYITAFPSGGHLIVMDSSSGVVAAGIVVTTSGTLRLVDQAQAQIGISTTVMPLNQWVRLEGHFVHSATVGQVELKIFTSADSATPAETVSTAADKNTLASANRFRVGQASGLANIGPYWIDSVVAGATGWVGPAPVDIAGQTASSYTVVEADYNLALDCNVTAANEAGGTAARTAFTAAVTVKPDNTVPPAVTGTAQVTLILTTDNGTWTHDPDTYGYQWQQSDTGAGGWTDILGATNNTLTVNSALETKFLRSAVTASNEAGPVTAFSASTTAVAAAPSALVLRSRTLLHVGT